MALEKDYEIILLDIKMPNMDGIQFLEQLRQNAGGGTGADHYRLPQHSQRGGGDASGRLRLCHQAVHVRGDHVGRAAGAGHSAHSRGGWRDRGRTRRWRCLPPSRRCCSGASPGFAWSRRFGMRGRGVARTARRDAHRDTVCRGSAKWSTRACRWPASRCRTSRRCWWPRRSPVWSWRSTTRFPNTSVGSRAILAATGWIAHICTTEYDREAEQCGPRRILLANADAASAQEQGKKLTSLGCEVQTVADREALVRGIEGHGGPRRLPGCGFLRGRGARSGGADQPAGSDAADRGGRCGR